MTPRRLAIAAAVLAACAIPASSAAAATPPSHGQLPHLLKPRFNANQSSNWFGYDRGALEPGSGLIHSISGDWTVPTASLHTKGQDAASSTWIGIGGGCMETSCTATDSTLIQTGTEQDANADGTHSYYAWWEIIPAPSITFTKMTVRPGDHMHADIHEVVAGSEVWSITLRDVTRNETATQTVPYTSTYGSAEWINETPLLIGANAGFSALPNLTKTPFDLGRVNGAAVKLKTAEQMDLVDSNGKVIGVPSAPDADLDGFAACAWTTSCSPPSS